MKPAEFQLIVHLDEISNLKDKDFFCDDILITINSRIESAPDRNGVRRPPINDTRWVASVVGCRYVLLLEEIRGIRLNMEEYIMCTSWLEHGELSGIF